MHSENIGPETCPASPHRFNMGKFSNFQKLPKCDALRQYWARNLPKCDALRKYWARDMSRIGPWGWENFQTFKNSRNVMHYDNIGPATSRNVMHCENIGRGTCPALDLGDGKIFKLSKTPEM